MQTTENQLKTDKNSGKKPWQFKSGQSGNPNGRPKGAVSPITRIKNLILAIAEKNEAAFEKALQEEAKKNPVAFYLKFVTPFMPKAIDINDVTPDRDADREEVLKEMDLLEEHLSKKNKNGKAGA